MHGQERCCQRAYRRSRCGRARDNPQGSIGQRPGLSRREVGIDWGPWRTCCAPGLNRHSADCDGRACCQPCKPGQRWRRCPRIFDAAHRPGVGWFTRRGCPVLRAQGCILERSGVGRRAGTAYRSTRRCVGAGCVRRFAQLERGGSWRTRSGRCFARSARRRDRKPSCRRCDAGIAWRARASHRV